MFQNLVVGKSSLTKCSFATDFLKNSQLQLTATQFSKDNNYDEDELLCELEIRLLKKLYSGMPWRTSPSKIFTIVYYGGMPWRKVLSCLVWWWSNSR